VRLRLLVVVLTASLLGAAPPARAGSGDVIVRFRAAATADDRSDARRAGRVKRERGLPVAGMELADPEAGVSAQQAAARLERDPGVLYAEPDAPRVAFATFPDDDFFGLEWGLHNTGQSILGVAGVRDADIDAPEAWDVTVGDPAVVVAVADSGVDAAHPDLAPNLDPRGYDFVEGDTTPQDEDGHGTHVAGTVAASGDDGVGVTGAAWRVTALPLRILGADGTGSVSDAIRAYAYAAEAGARVVNLSLGGDVGSRAERDAIAAQDGMLFVTAAGNVAANNDETGSFPCNYDLANVVCVAASDQFDALADFSNYGARTVDLAAPGVSIASTYPGADWVYMDGTSMATPAVTGVAALLLASEPGATVATLRRALLEGTDRKLSLAGTTVTGGRLNALGALRELGVVPPAEPPPEDRTEEPARDPQPQPEPQPAPEPAPEAAPAPQPAPEPAPAPVPAPLAPRDASAPFVRFTTSPSRDLAAFVRRRAMRVTLRCNEPCAVRVELRRGTRLVARGRASLATGAATLRLRLGARERARLRRLRKVRLTLRVRAVDPAGNARSVTRRVVLRR
jgi:subtilisin family serine protease